MNKRYEVVVYCAECGIDEALDFSNFKDAEKYAKAVLSVPDLFGGGLWECAAIYDNRTRTIKSLYNCFDAHIFFNDDVCSRSIPKIIFVAEVV